MAIANAGEWILTLLPKRLPGQRTEPPDVMRAAQDRERGMLSAKPAHGLGEFLLFYNDRRAMLLFFHDDRGVLGSVEVWEGPCRVANFPNRHAWPDEPEEYCCGCGDCYFASGRHSVLRAEGFLLLRECLRTGEPADSLPVPKGKNLQPFLPGMEEFIIWDEEWRRVTWHQVASGNLL